MVDSRIERAAEILVDYSTGVKKNDKVQIIVGSEGYALALAVYKRCLQKGAYPGIKASIPGQTYTYFKHATKEQLSHFPEVAMFDIKRTDVVIAIGGPKNTRELSSIDPEKINIRQITLKPISDYRIEKTRWVLFDYPTHSQAQEADMSLEEFEDFVFSATNINWLDLVSELNKVKELMNKTNRVKIVGEDTDISFRIKNRKAVVGDGTNNMPDGEVFTAVVEDSVNGKIKFSFPAIWNSREVEDISLVFKNGKVIKASATKNEDFLNKTLNMDKGAKYVGEFAFGLNPNITKFTKNILFDEKIDGTIHLALGQSYKECKGKNISALHWDMIKDMKNGGIYFDDKLVYKNGKFI